MPISLQSDLKWFNAFLIGHVTRFLRTVLSKGRKYILEC